MIINCDDYAAIIGISQGILGMIQFAIPILLIIMGTLDLGKAVISSDEKEMKSSTSKLIKRAMAAIAVFLVTAMVNLTMNMVASNTQDTPGSEGIHNFIACQKNNYNNNQTSTNECVTDRPIGTCPNGSQYRCIGSTWQCQ
jgi:hypothetical protein